MSTGDWIALAIGIVMLGYLVYALLWPERF
ncbi:MAG TPA: K(+)-transporting ATPase subunit F [Thermomicrobiales bacterium]|jgi:K+-transporting ATPase KdpF subunit|nr:K(+)-transporting ATPase subunit F [Thermomicrobiales bacterium]